jgi:hypothetical protein
MRKTLLIALAAAGALAASQGLAQDEHAAHHPAPAVDAKAASSANTMADMDPAAMHQMCKGMMGKKMAAKSVHEHSREKNGLAMWPNGKPLTKSEMAAMHDKCAAMMEAEHAAPADTETPK